MAFARQYHVGGYARGRFTVGGPGSFFGGVIARSISLRGLRIVERVEWPKRDGILCVFFFGAV